MVGSKGSDFKVAAHPFLQRHLAFQGLRQKLSPWREGGEGEMSNQIRRLQEKEEEEEEEAK